MASNYDKYLHELSQLLTISKVNQLREAATTHDLMAFVNVLDSLTKRERWLIERLSNNMLITDALVTITSDLLEQ